MKNVLLYTCTLTLCLGFNTRAQVLNNGFVDHTPVRLWNNILNGWSACEKQVTALKEERSADSLVISLKNIELFKKDSSETILLRKNSACETELVREKEISEDRFKELQKGCPPQRKPLLLNPWTYVSIFGGFVTGVYVGSRMH